MTERERYETWVKSQIGTIFSGGAPWTSEVYWSIWQAAVPPGYVLVPAEPTPEMIEAARDTKRHRLWRAVEIIRDGKDPDRTDKWMGEVSADEYRAMIAARPGASDE